MQIHLSDITDSEGKIIQFSSEVELDKISFQMGEFPIIRTEGYLEEVTEDGNKIKRVTEKGRSVGIDEEERKAKFGGSYYAITHSKQSQQVIIEMLKKHYSGIKP